MQASPDDAPASLSNNRVLEKTPNKVEGAAQPHDLAHDLDVAPLAGPLPNLVLKSSKQKVMLAKFRDYIYNIVWNSHPSNPNATS